MKLNNYKMEIIFFIANELYFKNNKKYIDLID